MFSNSTEVALLDFIKERGWENFHTEEELAKAITLEAGELLKNYQWGPDWPYKLNPENKEEEIADVLIFCFYYCIKLGCNPDAIVWKKIMKNHKKYPVPEEKL